MPSSIDYLGRSWRVKTQKVWGGAVQCGRGQGNAQQMRTRCEQRDRNFWRSVGRGQKFSARDISSVYFAKKTRYKKDMKQIGFESVYF